MAVKDFTNQNNDDNSGNNGNNNNNGFGGVGMFSPSGSSAHGGEFDVSDITINYNKTFKNAEPALFRDTQVFQTITSLSSKIKPNAILIGPAGSGKTKIVEEIARLIANDDPIIPTKLKGYTIYELPISNLVAGANYVGDLESNVKEMINFFSDKKNKAILFIDEIHQLVNNSDSSYRKIAQIIKPALARGDMRVIGATTSQEAKKFLNDPALNRRFSDVIVPELSFEQTSEIVRILKTEFSKYHSVTLPDGMEDKMVAIAEKHKKIGMHRPDTAITLLDKSMADAALRFQIKKLKIMESGDKNLIAAINNINQPTLSEEDIERSALSLLSGNDDIKLNTFEIFKSELETNIVSQDKMKEILLDCIKRKTLGAFQEKKPLSLLFAGVTGTGKTETAKIIAKSIFGNEESLITINMTEYHSSASINRIIGSPDGYIGSDSDQELPFDSLESNPRQVILLDEFEKGDSSVQRLFMQALDEGSFKTNRNKNVDFSRCIIIATTNAGVEELAKQRIGISLPSESDEKDEKDVINALKKDFDIELLNRFDHIVPFQSLSKDDYRNILIVKYNKLIKEASKNINNKKLSPEHIDPDYESEILDKLVDESYKPMFGGRPAEKTMKKFIEDTVINESNKTNITLL